MALTPGLQLPYGIQPVNPVPVDTWSGPYSGANEAAALGFANAAISIGVRFQSMGVRLIIADIAHMYWYKDGIDNSDLVEFVVAAAGSDTYVQFNDGGTSFGGDAGLTYNKTTDTLTVAGDLVVNGGDITTTAATFNLLNDTAITINLAGGASTALNLGHASATNTVLGKTKFSQGLSGSLTKLTDGTSYLLAGNGITISSASNGTITIAGNIGNSNGETFSKGKFSGTLQDVSGNINIATVGSLLPGYDDETDIDVYLNGQLLASPEDYTMASDTLVHFSDTLHVDDIITVKMLVSSSAVIGPGGSNTYVQFNDNGVFGGDAGLTYNKTTDTLFATIVTASLGFSGSLTKLNDGTSFIIAGNNVTISSASNGAITINSVIAAGQVFSKGKFSGSLQDVSGNINIATIGSLLPGYDDETDIDVYLNGQLLAAPEDYTMASNTLVHFNDTLHVDDIISVKLLVSSSAITDLAALGLVTSPGGSNTYIQFNDGGVFGGDSGLIFNKTTNALTVAGPTIINDELTVGGGSGSTGVTISSTGNIHADGTITVGGASNFNGIVTLGDSSVDTVTFTGHVGSDILPSVNNTYNLGSESKHWANIYTGDLHLKNDRGNWTIIEEEDYLCVVNNITGKKYKMMLQPIED